VIVRWPGRVRPGSVSDVPVIGTDFYPTVLEAAGLPARAYQHVDGISLVPVLTGTEGIERDALYWHYPHYNRHPHSYPSSVIRQGRWKLIEHLETGKMELYDLSADIGETTDLASSQPDRAKDLAAKLAAWRDAVGADPMKPNPQYEGPR
jgi:arylsulfatase A-like enzyme